MRGFEARTEVYYFQAWQRSLRYINGERLCHPWAMCMKQSYGHEIIEDEQTCNEIKQ